MLRNCRCLSFAKHAGVNDELHSSNWRLYVRMVLYFLRMVGSMSYFILAHDQARQRAQQAIKDAQQGYVVTIKEPTRNLEQNSLLWALLSQVSKSVVWHGQKLSTDDWKNIFSASLKKTKVVPGLDGGFVVCGQSTSSMSKKDFSDLCEIIFAFGANHGVEFSERPALESA
jgi:hypothetical protein